MQWLSSAKSGGDWRERRVDDIYAGLYADTYVIPLRDVAVVERSNNDAKVRLLIRSSGRSFTLRKKLLAGDKVNDAFAAILAKLTTV